MALVRILGLVIDRMRVDLVIPFPCGMAASYSRRVRQKSLESDTGILLVSPEFLSNRRLHVVASFINETKNLIQPADKYLLVRPFMKGEHSSRRALILATFVFVNSMTKKSIFHFHRQVVLFVGNRWLYLGCLYL